MSGADKKPGLSELADRAIWLLFAVIVGYLLLASIFSTCYLGGYRYPTADASVEVNIEHTFYIRDHFLQHIVVFLLFSLCLLCIKAGRIGRVIRSRYFVPAVCIVSGVLAGLCVYCAAVVGLFLLFYPVLAGQTVTTEYVDKYLRWMESWVLIYG